ncbi:MAG: helix-turn-helix transcriptional regulator [Alphaproteobacteria bacterium]|nr:helix-turn-helix transcriptional regulator [Alphaproteobacteria bacterium]
MKLVVENSGESQTAVAAKLGVSQPRLNQYLNEKREADYAFVSKFCHYFHITPNYLFEFESSNLNEDAVDCFINIVEKIEDWSQKHKVFYDPIDKAELVRLIYRKVYDLPEQKRNSKIIDFLEVYDTLRQ